MAGTGDPVVVFLHALGSRRDWDPIWDDAMELGRVVRFDLPGFGDSPRDTLASTPEAVARLVADDLSSLGISRAILVGLSLGGWVALELAKLGRAEAVLGLGTAGLWRRHSLLLTDLKLNIGWLYARVYRPIMPFLLRLRPVRRLALRDVSARPADIPAEWAIESSRQLARARGWPRFYRHTRKLRFTGGEAIDVPVVLAFGARDRIAPARKSRHVDQLPAHVEVQTWEGSGHNLVWDAPDRVLSALRTLAAAPNRATGRTTADAPGVGQSQ
ncbi:MAG: hypothetical protein QOI80_3345 [Solirubrobacteraceae bacterium]|nr:hypothetical protein [Solirubrobacteraceae bacterium]